MINVTRLDNSELVINSDLIEILEAIPETIIHLTTGKKIMVKEMVDEIIERIIAFKRSSQEIKIHRGEERQVNNA